MSKQMFKLAPLLLTPDKSLKKDERLTRYLVTSYDSKEENNEELLHPIHRLRFDR